MTRDEAQARAEGIVTGSNRFAFVFEVPKGFVIGTAERGGGWCSNFKEIGFGDSWEAALNDADGRIGQWDGSKS